MNKYIGLIIVTMAIPLSAADHQSDVRYPSARTCLRAHQYKTLENRNGSDADYSSEVQLIKPRLRRFLDQPLKDAMKRAHEKLVHEKRTTFGNYEIIMLPIYNGRSEKRYRI